MSRSSPPGLPLGFVPRVEKTAQQLTIVHGSQVVPWIMLDLDAAERFTRENTTASMIFPSGRVITTSTIHDHKLRAYHLERETEVVKAFRPALHIPCDRPVYAEENPEGRAWFIDSMVHSTLLLRDELRGTGTCLVPLVKGIDTSEWIRSFSPLIHEGFPGFAFYVKQYFGAGLGKRDLGMVHDVRGVISTCGMPYLLLVGYQSETRRSELPPAVKAFAGHRWRSFCNVGKVSTITSRRLLEELVNSRPTEPVTRQDILRQETSVALVEGE